MGPKRTRETKEWDTHPTKSRPDIITSQTSLTQMLGHQWKNSIKYIQNNMSPPELVNSTTVTLRNAMFLKHKTKNPN